MLIMNFKKVEKTFGQTSTFFKLQVFYGFMHPNQFLTKSFHIKSEAESFSELMKFSRFNFNLIKLETSLFFALAQSKINQGCFHNSNFTE